MKGRINFPSRASVKCLFTLFALLLVWKICTSTETSFQGTAKCDDQTILENKESNLIVVVVDFHGSVGTLMHWTNSFFGDSVAHKNNVKVIATVKFSLGN